MLPFCFKSRLQWSYFTQDVSGSVSCVCLSAVFSPRPGAGLCARRLRGEACSPWAQPGDGSHTASLWRSILQTTPRHQKTQAEESLGVSRMGKNRTVTPKKPPTSLSDFTVCKDKQQLRSVFPSAVLSQWVCVPPVDHSLWRDSVISRWLLQSELEPESAFSNTLQPRRQSDEENRSEGVCQHLLSLHLTRDKNTEKHHSLSVSVPVAAFI